MGASEQREYADVQVHARDQRSGRTISQGAQTQLTSMTPSASTLARATKLTMSRRSKTCTPTPSLPPLGPASGSSSSTFWPSYILALSHLSTTPPFVSTPSPAGFSAFASTSPKTSCTAALLPLRHHIAVSQAKKMVKLP